MRVGVVDVGTNSTRLLVADVRDGRVGAELARRSEVTRLGAGVDATGELSEAAIGRVFGVLEQYRAELDRLAAQRTVAVLTSAVRDARNGPVFTAEVARRYGLEARTIDGDEEARLTFLGATSERPPGDERDLLVVDIGGGSTELVLGRGRDVRFHVSNQAGVVRQSERHLHVDPPAAEELAALSREVRGIVEGGMPAPLRAEVDHVVAVAGTATASAAIDLALERYDPARVHGHWLSLARLESLRDRLAAMPLAARREVPGLHPDRAPTILAGLLILIEVARAAGADGIEVSEHDILRGAALSGAAEPARE